MVQYFPLFSSIWVWICSKEFMIHPQSTSVCFFLHCIELPSLLQNTIYMILILTIWWCSLLWSHLCGFEEGYWYIRFSAKIPVSLALFHCVYFHAKLSVVSNVALDFLPLCIPVLCVKKMFFHVSSENLWRSSRTVQPASLLIVVSINWNTSVMLNCLPWNPQFILSIFEILILKYRI